MADLYRRPLQVFVMSSRLDGRLNSEAGDPAHGWKAAVTAELRTRSSDREPLFLRDDGSRHLELGSIVHETSQQHLELGCESPYLI
jgi:hypothetical protein